MEAIERLINAVDVWVAPGVFQNTVFNPDTDDAKKELKAINDNIVQWVSIDDRLPNEHQDILVYYYGNKNSEHFPELQFIKQSSFYNNEFECDEDVTHWAILPDPPCAKK